MFLKRLFTFIPKNEFSKALDLYNSGHYRKALRKFEELQAIGEVNEDVDQSTLDLYTCESHVALAREYAADGEIDEAIREMEAAVSVKPMFADLHYLLGTYYTEQGRYVDSQRCYRSSLDINNKFFRARVHLALALRATGDDVMSLKELVATRHSCPNFCRETLDGLIEAVEKNKGAEAIDDLYRELLEERPSSAQISKEIAIEAIQNGDNEDAIRELRKATALKPDYPDLHNFLGIAYGNAGLVEDAVQEFEVALKINPYYLKARLNLALLYYENSRYEDAQKQLDEVLAVQSDNQLANNLVEELKTTTHGN
ncbi:MAG: tetratricopeptide repeat protein [Candidatus Krumholzibacteriota bacterium]|nr:tetratricopeptide repeat protein [Candidatus Krumholzibacteriota bacterium]